MNDFLGSALKFLRQAAPVVAGAALGPVGAVAAPVLGNIAGNVLSGINQRAARNWEEDMYNMYNSPSALVRQYEDAGINPSLMFGQTTPAAPTDTAAAPVMDSPTGNITEMLAQMMNLSLLDKQGRKLDSEAALNEASASKTEFDLEVDRQFAVIQRQYSISEFIARLNKLEEETETTHYEREVIGPLREALMDAQAKGQSIENAINNWKKAYMYKFDADPDSDPLKQSLTSILAWLNGEERKERKENRRQNAQEARKNPTTPPGFDGSR